MCSTLSPVNPFTFIHRAIERPFSILLQSAVCTHITVNEHWYINYKNCVLFVTINNYMYQMVSLSLMNHLGLVSYYQVLYCKLLIAFITDDILCHSIHGHKSNGILNNYNFSDF